jgi:diguanylate cyclase (GGDEF)-like protein
MTDPIHPSNDLPSTISLLLVAEDDLTAARIEEILSRPQGVPFRITHVQQVDDALGKLQHGGFDVLLLDLSIHERFGLDSLLRARVAARSVPIVVLTYPRDEELALKAVRAGAQDYLIKGEVTPTLVSRTLLHAVERHRMLRDLTEAKQQQHFLATHDPLTQLPNRYAFRDALQSAVADAQRNDTRLAVMFMDLDGFKSINDNLGHSAGDELLTDVASRLRQLIRKSDLVARLGGDEFVAAIRNMSDADAPLRVAEQIREEIEKPYYVNGLECWISTSIGIASYPEDGCEADLLIRAADTAMYQAKASGKNQIRFFHSDMNQRLVEHFDLVNGLREAIHSGQLVLMFQPQIDVVTEEFIGAETLVRWHHPTRGLVSPGEFISVAEGTGMMVPLGDWVLRSACEAAACWEAFPRARVAVNVSARQLDDESFPDRVGEILERTGLPAHRLEVELTESLAANERIVTALGCLQEMGVRAAIDDFGTGYSSLTRLKRLPVNTLKVDQSFVRGAAATERDALVLDAIIRMTKGLGLEVLAEGVETMEEMNALIRFGCTRMQGYLFSKPIPRLDFDAQVGAADSEWRAPLANCESWRGSE